MTSPSGRDSSTTRREFVVGSALAGALLVTGRLPFGLDMASAAPTPWTYTDDRRKKIVLARAPQRIVAYADAAAALFNFGIVPVGIFSYVPLKDDPQLKKLPLSRIKQLGSVYGEIQLEELVALRPDLVVSVWYPPPLDAVPFGFKDKAQLETVDRIAPVLAVNAHVMALRGLRKFARLSVALGASLKAPSVVEARARFDKASATVKAAAAKKRGLRILAISAYGGNLYIAQPRDHSDLSYLRSLGVNIVVPNTSLAYWEVLSYEQAGKYQADVVLYDARPFGLSREELLKIPTIANLPAVRAGQFIPWKTAPPLDYGTYAAILTAFAGMIRNARSL